MSHTGQYFTWLSGNIYSQKSKDHPKSCDNYFVVQYFEINFGTLNESTIKHQSCASAGIWHSACTWWLGWAMVLGSFQRWGVLLLLHIVGQGPAMLAAGARRVGYRFCIFHLSSICNVMSFGRRLNMTEIL